MVLLILGAVALWLLLSLFALLLRERFYFVFPLSAVGSLCIFAGSVWALSKSQPEIPLVFYLSGFLLHLRLDALASVFLALLGASSFGISLYCLGYFRRTQGATPSLLGFWYHLFLSAMALVLLADDAYAFMMSWEIMALSSYFLVVTDHRITVIRKAGFLYLLIAHLGAFAILLSFAILGKGDWSFAAMRQMDHSAGAASVAFLLSLLGFGAKAGVLPFHVWLPEAHPAAPSPVSALMSGVMLKTAVYGMIRVGFDLLPLQLWWWGAIVLGLGLLAALFGVLFGAVETDMKRLLAYSSIENIGILLVGMGLGLIFFSFDMAPIAALALTATLYHAINHSLFKSLLFLATGSVLHATSERNLGKLGGLVHPMPKVALLTLVGVLALAGLPPLNGFASEWLLLQTFLLTPSLPNSFLNMLIPVAAGGLVLASALAAYVMVKFYGVVFLGQPREEKLKTAHDADFWERLGMGWLAAGCILLGILPVSAVLMLDKATKLLVGVGIGQTAGKSFFFLTPIASERASYSPLFFLLVVLAAVILTFVAVRFFYHGRVHRAPAWDCGFGVLTPRMEDTAEGFGQPIRQILEPVFSIERQTPDPFSEKPRYHIQVEDRLWTLLYRPIVRVTEWVAARIAMMQHGRIYGYLLYMFATLLLLLFLAR